MGFITAAIVGGLVLGGAAAVNQAKNAKKQRQQTKKIADQQEREARNLAAQGDPLLDTGADIEIGTEGTDTMSGQRSTTGSKTRKRPTSQSSLGGAQAGGVGGLIRNTAGSVLR